MRMHVSALSCSGKRNRLFTNELPNYFFICLYNFPKPQKLNNLAVYTQRDCLQSQARDIVIFSSNLDKYGVFFQVMRTTAPHCALV